ncbi:MAG TPA: UDP-N-acetylmuramoyl-L-alanine--D-glutamate ligase [Bryobacterales bacterium]|nr:UDP-N-acetylmuramoyl-L-alanine--D-glutamate ligase [Bryobacterales bacterium]
MRQLEKTRALVIGLGRSGEAAAAFLVSRGAQVAATDAKPEAALGAVAAKLRAMGVCLHLGGTDAAPFLAQDLIVVSPGVPWDLHPLVEARGRGIDVIGEVELAVPYLQGPILGITGSNGKTTTTILAGHLLARGGLPVQVGGNVGMPYPPVIAMVGTSAPGQWNVIELSSFQLESSRTLRAHIAVALNVTPDHLDRHGTFERYAAAKARLFATQQPGDFAVLNADDPTCVQYGMQTRGEPVWFSRTHPVSPGASVAGGWIVFERGGATARLAEVASIPIRGAHNLENTLAAAAAAFLAGVKPEAIARAVPEFRAVEHRLEFVRRVNGVDYYNDSKATNVDAAAKALEAFDGRLWVILGGKDKGSAEKPSDYAPLRDLIARQARGVLLVGAAASKIAAQLEGAAPLIEAGTIARAVSHAAAHAQPGDTVLLAPACASFDQFENYEHRGRVFKELVAKL